jgi:hypothetical protein
MLTLASSPRQCRTRVSRRDVLQVGALVAGGLTLPGLLRMRAQAGTSTAHKSRSVILVWLRGGPSHIDSVDMKPNAPAEIRGEFQPIPTSVPGIQVCEHLPRLAANLHRVAILRGLRSNDLGDHTPHYIVTGNPDRGKRPAFGCVVSHFRSSANRLPPYVSLMYEPPGLYDNEGPVYLDAAHRPFAPRDDGLENLLLAEPIPLDRLRERRQLLQAFDSLGRRADQLESLSVLNAYQQQAINIIQSRDTRDAFDIDQESAVTRARYGDYCENFLVARRLAEAGVPVITLKVGDWDTHEKNFIDMRTQLPLLDQGLDALVGDLYDRGLDRQVAVVVWGEFGRAPRISRGDGRDHWPEAGAAIVAGGGFQTGQVIGETDSHGGSSLGTPYTPGNVLASLYFHLGIDPTATLPDQNQRPIPLLDERTPVRELG